MVDPWQPENQNPNYSSHQLATLSLSTSHAWSKWFEGQGILSTVIDEIESNFKNIRNLELETGDSWNIISGRKSIKKSTEYFFIFL